MIQSIQSIQSNLSNLSPSSPTLIIFEGMEAAGKTTQAYKLLSFFLQNDVDSIYTQEPGGSQIGNEIKDILFDNYDYPAPLTDLFLFLADRSQHINDIINPALTSNQIVICDRFSLSTLAYQSFETPLSLTQLKAVEAVSRRFLEPCHIIQLVLDISPQTSFERIHKLGTLDRIEQKPFHFYQHVSNIFREQHDLLFPHSHSFLVDSTISTDKLHDTILELLNKVI